MDIELTRPVMERLHQKMVYLLPKKLEPLRKANFLGGRKPTLDDYYKLNNACFPEHIPRALSLPFVFENYDLFASNNFSGCKFKGRFDIARATWYWSIDKKHTFSHDSSQMSVNFLLAGIALARPSQIEDPELLQFIQLFTRAFIAHNNRAPDFKEQEEFLDYWYKSKYDLIDFTAGSMKKIMAVLKVVKKNMPPHLPFAPCDYYTLERFQYHPSICEYAIIWAVRWLIDMESLCGQLDELEMSYNASPDVFQDEMCASLAGVDMGNNLPSYVTPEHFTRPETQALLKDIEIYYEPTKKIDSVMWMDPKAATERILDSNLDAVLQELLSL